MKLRTLLHRICLLLLVFAMPLPLLASCRPETPPAGQEQPSETPEDPVTPPAGEEDEEPSDGTIKNAVENPVLPTAPIRASKLLLVKTPGGADSLTAGTLQGLVAAVSSEQILFLQGAHDKYMPYIETLGVSLADKNEQGEEWTLPLLLSYFSSHLKGYILCNEDLDSESASVAVSLSGLLSAVVVTPANESLAKDAGLSLLLDVTDKNDAWLRESEYFSQLRTDIAVEQPASMAPRLIDYAAMTKSYCFFYRGKNPDAHERKFEFLDDGATVIGWNNTLGEYDTVMSLSKLSAQLVPADHAFNLSTLSGFSIPSISQDLDEPVGQVENKHTVCFILSDGDNLQWFLNDYSASRWYGSPYRGEIPMGWGVPAGAADLASPMLQYFYDNATANDEFLLQLSGIGYTFPSRWNEDARYDMASDLADVMERMDLKYLEILDDYGFQSKYMLDFAAQDQIEGIFYIDYANYAGRHGSILFVDDTPVVSARHRLWADFADGSIQTIANALNRASTDPTNAAGYSFVIVHAWSGVNAEGKFTGSGGDSIAAVSRVIDLLGDSVEVVGMDEFMTRIKNNIPH